MNQVVKRVIVPEREMHEGIHKIAVNLVWTCPVCGSPRGEIENVLSYDGSRRLHVNGWVNGCDHVDKYSAVRREAKMNGLN